MESCKTGINDFSRCKTLSLDSLHRSPFKRCLAALHLSGIGVSFGAGLGVYVIVPHIARDAAGPAAVLSFIIAGVTALLCGLCYAECSTRLPRAGSVYIYTYTVFGELAAFIVGWTMILEYILIGAVSGKAWGQCFDYLFDGQIGKALSQKLILHLGPYLEDHLDLPAFSIIITVVFISALLAKSLAVAVFIMTVVSVLVIMAIVCVGFFHVDSQNWREPPGFFANGMIGVLQGSAACLVSFIGIDAVANLAEDTRVPCKMIPKAISTVFLCLFVTFFGLSLALTLVYSWKNLPSTVAIARSYSAQGITGSNYVIGAGGLIALLASLMCSMYCLPRNIYAMANDRLIPRMLSFVSEITQAPILASCLGGTLTAVIAMFVCIETLVQMLSIGTLLAFGVTAACTLFLRYDSKTIGLHKEYEDLYDMVQSTTLNENDNTVPKQTETDRDKLVFPSKSRSRLPDSDERVESNIEPSSSTLRPIRKSVSADTMSSRLDSNSFVCTPGSHLDMQINQIDILPDTDTSSDFRKPILKDSRAKRKMYVMVQSPSLSSIITTVSEYTISPSTDSLRVVKTATLVLVLASISMAILCVCGKNYVTNADWWAIFFLSIFIVSISGSVYCIVRQPRNHSKLLYSTPYVPFAPVAGLFLTIILAVALPLIAWIRFGVWTVFGLFLYIGYGIRHSKEKGIEEEEVVLYDVADRRSSEEPAVRT